MKKIELRKERKNKTLNISPFLNYEDPRENHFLVIRGLLLKYYLFYYYLSLSCYWIIFFLPPLKSGSDYTAISFCSLCTLIQVPIFSFFPPFPHFYFIPIFWLISLLFLRTVLNPSKNVQLKKETLHFSRENKEKEKEKEKRNLVKELGR